MRLYNLALLNCSYYLSKLLKKPIHWGTPFAVSIEPTTACNLRCPECPSGLRQFSRPTGNLQLSTNRDILDQLGSRLQHVNYYFQGEPYIHPHFNDLVKDARKRNLYVVTSTNAHFLSIEKAKSVVESGLSELIISIDGLTQETYESYRKEGKLEKVIEGTKNMVAAKKELNSQHPVLTFQFLVTSQNEHQIDELHQFAKDLGVDEVRLKTIQVYDYENGNNLIPKNEAYSRYKKNNAGKYQLKNTYSNSCWRSWSSCVFTWDAKVVPCCFDKDAQHQLGSLENQSFKEIWKGSIMKSFQSQLLKDRKQIEICTNCSEGSKIWV